MGHSPNNMACGCLFRLLRWLFFLGIVVFILHWWVSTKEYLFSEDAVGSIAQKYVGQNITVSQKAVHKELLSKYPGHILPEQDLQWIFVNAGGWMGSMCLMHASLTEYVLVFGSAVDTVGHSGRYWANISDTILTGTFRQWKEGEQEVSVHKPGETVMHVWGEATSVNFVAGTWMLEYGRGFIPSTMGFALADTIFSTQDVLTLYYTFRIYIKAMALEASHYVIQFRDYIEHYL